MKGEAGHRGEIGTAGGEGGGESDRMKRSDRTGSESGLECESRGREVMTAPSPCLTSPT